MRIGFFESRLMGRERHDLPARRARSDAHTCMIVRAIVASCVALLTACAAQRPAPASTARNPAPSPSMQIADSSKQETATTSSTLAEPTPQAAPKPEPQAEAKPAPGAQRESKPEPKPGAEAKPETKPETKLAPKPEPKPKPAPKPSSAATQPAQPQSKPPSTASAPPSAATKPPAPAPAPLDLASLEERLKETSAIGLLTKLSLKNQVDDLVGEFRAYHRGVRPPTLSQLRPAFELLLMKVLSLLQDRDPKLAHDVSTSRDAIWGVLVDPHKLAEFS
jgi:hypothetical protein